MHGVVLVCGADRYERAVPRGSTGAVTVTFPMRPGRECSVQLMQNAGTLTQMGSWRCTEHGCAEVIQDIGDIEVLAPGEVKIVTTVDLPHPTVELSCPSGYRQRAPVTDYIARFSGVPQDDCTLMFKGGAPYRYRPIGWGTWACSVVSATLVCEHRG